MAVVTFSGTVCVLQGASGTTVEQMRQQQQRQKTRSSQDEKMCSDSVRKKVDHFLNAKVRTEFASQSLL